MDGFRFDLAACLCRDPHGTPLEAPPVIREISKDPVLSKVPPRGYRHDCTPYISHSITYISTCCWAAAPCLWVACWMAAAEQCE